jgi:hypothetical protein
MFSYIQTFVQLYLDHLGKIVISAGLLTVIGLIIYRAIKKVGGDLQILVQKTLAAAAIPSGFALIICAFETSLIQKIYNAEVYLLVSGIAVLYVSLISIFPQLGYNPPSDNQSTPPPRESRKSPPPGPRST